MRFLIDEDVDVAVGALLAPAHDVEYVKDVFPPATKDPVVVRYAQVERRVLVTGDRPESNRQRQQHKVPCLFLHGLYTLEMARTSELLAVIESEFALLGDRFWMEIATDYYKVTR
jgi:predicted nuclease of predicted toxin-antitoxin system